MTDMRNELHRTLYPFLHTPEPLPDDGIAQKVLDEVRQSIRRKCADVIALRRQLLAEYADTMIAAAEAMADRFAAGGKLLAFGNGGSATDAQDTVTDCMAPPFAAWRALPALALTGDSATITALANDVGVESIFARQVIAFGQRGDVALGISTSGQSANVVAALDVARRRGMLTVALSGGDGGALAAPGALDFCFVSRIPYVPRAQEGHATVWHTLLELVQQQLATGNAKPAAAGARQGVRP